MLACMFGKSQDTTKVNFSTNSRCQTRTHTNKTLILKSLCTTPGTTNRHHPIPILEYKVLRVVFPRRKCKLANLLQKVLVRALTWNEYQSSIWRPNPCSNEVAIRIVRITFVVESARHGSGNNAARHSANIAEGEVVFDGFLVVAVDERDLDFLVWITFAYQ